MRSKTPTGTFDADHRFTETDVTITGGTLAGHSRAGRLPRTPVTGERPDA
ncbi:hypothetical protein [Amycolatopsis sp. CA-126428]|nr:hypothetical protein [Amycolatopsis sp. CA-126428]